MGVKNYSEKLIIAARQNTRERNYWLNQLSDKLVKTSFSLIDKKISSNESRTDTISLALAPGLVSKLQQITKASDRSLNLVLIAVLNLLLNKYTGSEDIIMGTPIYKQETEGEFINTVLVLRNRIEKNIPFKEFINRVRQTIQDAVKHQNYPVDLLVQELNIETGIDPADPYSSLFNVAVMLENIHDKKYLRHIHCDVIFIFNREDNGIRGIVEYNSSLYSKSFVEKIIVHFTQLLHNCLFNSHMPLTSLEIFTETEKNQLLYEFNDTAGEYPKEKTIGQWFEEQVEKTPGAPAVSCPLDISDIYDFLETGHWDTDANERLARLGPCCFKQSPYIFRTCLESTPGTTNLILLKTYRHNSIIIDQNIIELLRLFDGSNNIKSIYTLLKDIKPSKEQVSFLIFTMEKNDLLEVFFQFNHKPGVFSFNSTQGTFADFARLVQVLYSSHIIGLERIKPDTPALESPVLKRFTLEKREIPLLQAVIGDRAGTAKAQVLLLGDTPGTPGTGLLYLASYLVRNGITARCQFYDPSPDYTSMKAHLEMLLEKIQPQIVAISMKWFLYIARVLDMGKIIKEYSQAHGMDIKVVLGGNTASYYPEEFMEYDCIDILVRGDGEEPLLKICRGEDIAGIPNCVYKRNEQIIANPITYIQDETISPGIYLSHLDEILLSPHASRLGTFFIYTHKGCAMNCLYCGGCSQAQHKTFNREKPLKREIEAVRRDIMAAQPYTSTFHFEFDIPDTIENLLEYCKKIWAAIDLSDHFCVFSTLTRPSTGLIGLVSQTFKYVYWDLDICTPSQGHRQQLASMGLVKPQLKDTEILEFMKQCEKYPNIEVRPNLITGLPYFRLEDIEPGEGLLTRIMSSYSCFGELHWARLHAQPGAPIVRDAEKHRMHSYASDFEDFLKHSKESFNQTSGYTTVEDFNYPYIYFKDDQLNSRTTTFYLEINKKADQYRNERQRSLIVCDTLSYRELNEKAQRLLEALRAKGVKADRIVGLMLERSLDIPVGILGILKTGCAYMPIDPEFPPSRIEYMLKDSNTKILVTKPGLSEKFEKSLTGNCQFSIVNCQPAMNEAASPSTLTSTCQVSPANLAYIIYTSGTTGKPKGTVLTQRNLVNYVHWFSKTAGLTRDDKTILTSSFAFDLGYTSLFPSILNGGQLHILSREMYLLAEGLLEYIRQKEITYLKVTPSLFAAIINAPGFSSQKCRRLRMVAIGGEPIIVKDLEKAHALCPHLRIMNHYGPTEATIGCISTFVDFDHFAGYKKHPVIGKPIFNTNIYILAKDFNLLPVGVPGELCISGTGLAHGYLNRPGLTAERFCNAFYRSYKSYRTYIPGRVYHTGDLARWLPNGTIEFLGRIDTQVKIRGYRIELGEIENRLTKHPAIEEAVVVVKEAGDTGKDRNDSKYLCAYITVGKRTAEPPAGKIARDENKQTLPVKGPHHAAVAQFVDRIKTKHNEIAVKSNGRSLTYGSLNTTANRLARQILAEYDDRNKLSKKERTRYKRQILLHGWGIPSQEKLKSAVVFVAGAGGGASPTIMQLALTGYGTIIVCDCDEVELSNLNRQFLHDESRIGMNKALSAKMTIEKVNPHVTVIPRTEKLTRGNVAELVGEASIIFDMFDGLEAKFLLSEYATARGIPHVISAMTDMNAYAAILHPPDTPCYHCIFDKKKWETIVSGMSHYVESYEKNPLPVMATSLFMSTAFAVNEATKFILGFENPAYNKFLYFNQRITETLAYTPGFQAMTHAFSDYFREVCMQQGFDWESGWRGNMLEELTVKPNPDCPICSGKGKEKQTAWEKPVIKPAGALEIKRNDAADQEEKSLKTVGILLPHDIHMAAAVLAALKAGKSFVPLDPDAPEKHQLYVLEDSELRVILTDNLHLKVAEKLRNKYNHNIRIINIDNLDESSPTPGNREPGNENVEINPTPFAYLLYPPDPKGNPGFNTAVTDLYTALMETAGAYTFFSAPHKASIDPGSAPLAAQLRDYLLEELPAYMVPSYFVQLDKIPITPNGKVDRKALPDPEVKEKNDYTALSNDLEEKLADMWAEVLGIKKDIIGRDTNFFNLGGHSLNATILVSRIHKELNVKLPLVEFFKVPTIKGLSDYIPNSTAVTFTAVEPTEKKEYYQLSPAQKRLYILQQLMMDNTGYNMPSVIPLSGSMKKEKLELVFKELIRRHESLRTSFMIVNEEPVQKIHQEVDFSIRSYHARKEEVDHIISNFTKSFDLSRAPLLGVDLLTIGTGGQILLIDKHHIITDGVSQSILEKEFMTLYSKEELPPLRLQYRDYSVWQNSREERERLKKQEYYWMNQFEGDIPVLNLPTDYPRPPVQSFEGNSITFMISKEETRALNTLAAKSGFTLFMVLAAVANILFSKLSGQEEIIIGTLIAGRRHSDLEKIIGMFVNTLVLKNDVRGEQTYREFLGDIKEKVLAMFENQEYPFEEAVDRLSLNRDLGRNPLFDVMLIMQNFARPQEILLGTAPREPGQQVQSPGEKENIIWHISKFDLTINAFESGAGLEVLFEYCTKLFKKETIKRFFNYFHKIISTILKKPGIRIDEIEIISEEERKQVLYDFNDTGAIYSRDKTLQQLFEEQEERTPDRVVLLGSKLQNTNYRQMYLTYRQLKERSHRLAGLLIEKGIQPDTIVGIMVERSLEMMIGIIGILKSGGAYLPIDPNFPGERIDYMLKDSNAQVLVVDDTSRASWLSFAPKALLNLSEGHHLNFPASQLPSFQASLPSSLAYVIYTSGSTGKPKGVMIQHRSVINFIKGITDIIPFTADDCSLSLTTLSFDIFGLETILPITKGSKVVIGSEEEQADARKIASAIEKEKVTIFQVIPTRLKFILMDKVSSGTLKRLKYLLVGGEAFPPTLLEEAGKVVGGKIYNVYGPTETTIWSTIRNLTGQKLIDIGKPLVNTLVYILNKNHRPQPIKVPGDLYIGGEGLARGYVNRPELTAEKFDHNKKLLRGEPDPWISSTAGSHGNAPLIMAPRQQPETNKNQHKRFAQHIGTPRRGAPGRRRQKIYHTGDQARWLPDGNIEFLGRTDHQVKIRGFRVETREIESRLLHHPLITEAVVTARQDGSGDKYLCAYIVSEVELPVSELREHLAGDLPDYMIPSYFMRLEQIPLTSNGKIDRKALPEPGLKPGEKYVAPRDDIEKKLVSLYTDILLDRYQGASSFPEARIGIDDNFFELGGHSLKAIILVSKIHKELNVRLSLAVIFRIPTIRALALHIESSGTETFKAVAAVEERDYYPLSTTQRGIFIQQKKGKELTAYNIPQVLNLDFDIDKERLEESFKKLIHRHDSLRTSFRLINSDPVQQVHRDVGFIIRYYDNIKEEEIREIMATFVKPFDFDTPPLLRVRLIRWDRHRYILLFDMHHIITDGVSYEILRKEVVALYRGEKLPPLPIRYKDYSLWQNSKEVQEAIQKQKQVWLGRFAGEIPLLKLPLDFKRPAIKDFVGKQVDLTVGSELTTQLNRLAKQTDTTLYMVLLAAYFVLLSRYSQQEDIVVGSPVSGRRHADLHNIIGMFVNMLAIRNRPGKNKRFEDFLREVKESVLESIENQDYHFEELVIDLGLQGDPSRNPLFDVVFSMQSISESTTGEVGNENGREDRIKFEVSRFDLLLDAAEISGQIIMKIEYSTSLFNRSTIEDIARHYLEILQQVVENVSLKLEEIKLSHRLAAIKSAAIHEDGNFGF